MRSHHTLDAGVFAKMIDVPKEKVDAINLYRDMLNIKHTSQYFYNWLKDQLNILDVENRTAVEDFKQRQGAAQVLEAIIEQMNNSQEEVRRLTS